MSRIPRGAGAMRDHLERLLHHWRLKVVQWNDLNPQVVEFTTLTKGGTDGGPTELWQDRIINLMQSGSKPARPP